LAISPSGRSEDAARVRLVPAIDAVQADQTFDDEMVALSLRLATEDEAARTDAKKANRATNESKIRVFAERLAAAKAGIKALREKHIILATELAQLDVEALARQYQFKITPGSAVTGIDRANA
jgi:hypothetical protein